MTILEVTASETLKLRNEILRPGSDLGACKFPGDTHKSTHHFGAVLNGELVGIVSVYERSNIDVQNGRGFQIRAIATCKAVREQGHRFNVIKSYIIYRSIGLVIPRS